MSDLRTLFGLYTLEEVADLFPRTETTKPKAHLKLVEELVRKHGCFRAFGDAILLTRGDVADLMRNLSCRGSEDPEPTAADEGHIVFVGSRTDTTDDVFVSWAPPGGVQRAVSAVRDVVPDVSLLDFAAMTYGDYVAWTENLNTERRLGKWFHRTRKFNAQMNLLFPLGAKDGDDV